jgi:hypothetical protein
VKVRAPRRAFTAAPSRKKEGHVANSQEKTAELLRFGDLIVSLYPANGAWSIAGPHDDEIAAGLPSREAAIARAAEWAAARRAVE